MAAAFTLSYVSQAANRHSPRELGCLRRRRADRLNPEIFHSFFSDSVTETCPFQCGRKFCGGGLHSEAFGSLRVRSFSEPNRSGGRMPYSAKRRRVRKMPSEKSNWTNPWDDFSVDITQRMFKTHSLPESSVKESATSDDASVGLKESVSEEVSAEETQTETKSQSSAKYDGAETTDSSSKKAKPLSSLDSYFNKLKGEDTIAVATPDAPKSEVGAEKSFAESSSSGSNLNASDKSSVESSTSSLNLSKSEKALKLLDAYFDKINPPKPPAKVEEKLASTKENEIKVEPSIKEQPKLIPKSEDYKSPYPNNINENISNEPIIEIWLQSEAALRPSVVFALIALNIGIYLLELVTPQAIPGQLITSLPALYTAKVNSLILQGDWWRLVTPMFLHSGFFHLAIGSLSLCAVGLPMETLFGTAGFLGTYIAGGMFGNLLSFVQTPEVTIGGTGPVYALIGALIVFYLKNREALGTTYADGEARKFLFLGALNIFLGNPLPIDDWTHIGATFGGILYGLLAAPKINEIQVKSKRQGNVSSSQDQLQQPQPDVKILFELPSNKQQFWIFALNMALFVVLYDIATMIVTGTLPENLLDLI